MSIPPIIYLFILPILLNYCGISAHNLYSMFLEAKSKIGDYEIVSKSDNLGNKSTPWDNYNDTFPSIYLTV